MIGMRRTLNNGLSSEQSERFALLHFIFISLAFSLKDNIPIFLFTFKQKQNSFFVRQIIPPFLPKALQPQPMPILTFLYVTLNRKVTVI